jgi:hypothetical protein
MVPVRRAGRARGARLANTPLLPQFAAEGFEVVANVKINDKAMDSTGAFGLGQHPGDVADFFGCKSPTATPADFSNAAYMRMRGY